MHLKLIDSFPSFFSRVVYWELRQIFPFILKLMCSSQLSKGSYIERLSDIVQENFSIPGCITLDSGSSAIEFALGIFKLLQPYRDRVILPIYICPSVIRAVKKAGMHPCFMSVDNDLNLNPQDLKNLLDQDVLAVIVPHIYGYPAKISECVQIVKHSNPSIFLIDDAAPAFGTMVENHALGTWGDVGILSFGPSKKFTATGGGALLISNAEVLKIAQHRIKTIPEPSAREVLIKFIDFWWNFVCIRYSPTINYWSKKYRTFPLYFSHTQQIKKMSNLDAALVLWLLKHSDVIHQQRNRIIDYYIKELHGLSRLIFPQKYAHNFSVARFYMRTPGLTVQRNSQGQMSKEHPLVSYLKLRGIRTGYGYGAIDADLSTEGRKLRYEKHAWLDELIWLPIDYKKEVSDYKIVVDTIKAFFEICPQT